MKVRVLAALLATTTAMLAQPALADTPPVWETMFGLPVLSGDDTTTNRALSFAFPLFGSNYNDVTLSTNGFVQFGGSNGSGCCNGNTPDFLNGYPRIAPQWLDIVDTVYENTDVAGRAVYTWQGYEYGVGGAYNLQLQLFNDGRFSFGYNNTNVATSHTTLTGVTPGGGTADPGQTDYSSLTTPQLTGNTSYQLFSGGTFDLNGGNLFFTPSANGYLVSTAGYANAPTGAVPEPATWAMMLFGFGGIGFAMRRRKASTPRVRVAFA